MPCPLPQQDRYWRLDDYCTTTIADLQESLRAAGVKTKRDVGKPELIKEMHRLAKGGLNYKACATSMSTFGDDCLYHMLISMCAGELSKFIRDRKIKWPKDSMKRDALVAALEKADEEATFDKLLDLPQS